MQSRHSSVRPRSSHSGDASPNSRASVTPSTAGPAVVRETRGDSPTPERIVGRVAAAVALASTLPLGASQTHRKPDRRRLHEHPAPAAPSADGDVQRPASAAPLRSRPRGRSESSASLARPRLTLPPSAPTTMTRRSDAPSARLVVSRHRSLLFSCRRYRPPTRTSWCCAAVGLRSRRREPVRLLGTCRPPRTRRMPAVRHVLDERQRLSRTDAVMSKKLFASQLALNDAPCAWPGRP